MNRIVLIGNGFDLAHGLKTSYKDFIDWYWERRFENMENSCSAHSEDGLCTLSIDGGLPEAIAFWGRFDTCQRPRGLKCVEYLKKLSYPKINFSMSGFFRRINLSIESKGWVDVEAEYYYALKEIITLVGNSPQAKRTYVIELDRQLKLVQDLLIQYLSDQDSNNVSLSPRLLRKIYSPIHREDVAVNDFQSYVEHLKSRIGVRTPYWDSLLNKYEMYNLENKSDLYNTSYLLAGIPEEQQLEALYGKRRDVVDMFSLPDKILLLSFNYTSLAEKYLISQDVFSCRYIHGTLEDPDHVIFGYGDEMEETYMQIKEMNENVFLKNMKSIRYLETDNYRNALAYIESAPFQVYVMGHSCGNSDRTLLNTIFEHKNCVSIKPFYYVKPDGTDNYMEIVQNISRNFKNMKLMRDRVVNKMYCETLMD